MALKSGPHPYICDACEALQHGKNSQLLHRLGRASKLKYPWAEQNRATKQGVSHKYCNKEHLETALHNRALQNKTSSKKFCNLKISKIAGNIIVLCDHLWSSFLSFLMKINFLSLILTFLIIGFPKQ